MTKKLKNPPKTKSNNKKLKKLPRKLFELEFYCFKCPNNRVKVMKRDVKTRITKNKRHMLSTKCPTCGHKLNKFVREFVFKKFVPKPILWKGGKK
jgi:hypothetical protein